MCENALSNLKEGEVGYIKRIIAENSIRRRLYDIGIIPGTKVKCLQKSMFGDPVAFLVRGTVIALRNQSSSQIIIEQKN